MPPPTRPVTHLPEECLQVVQVGPTVASPQTFLEDVGGSKGGLGALTQLVLWAGGWKAAWCAAAIE
jgi:hypothetical protein